MRSVNAVELMGKLGILEKIDKKVLEEIVLTAVQVVIDHVESEMEDIDDKRREPADVLVAAWNLAGNNRDSDGRPYVKKAGIVRALSKCFGVSPRSAGVYVYGKSAYNPILPLLDSGLVSVDGNTVFLDGLIEETKEQEAKKPELETEKKDEKEAIKIDFDDPMWDGAFEILGDRNQWRFIMLKKEKDMKGVVNNFLGWTGGERNQKMKEYLRSIGIPSNLIK